MKSIVISFCLVLSALVFAEPEVMRGQSLFDCLEAITGDGVLSMGRNVTIAPKLGALMMRGKGEGEVTVLTKEGRFDISKSGCEKAKDKTGSGNDDSRNPEDWKNIREALPKVIEAIASNKHLQGFNMASAREAAKTCAQLNEPGMNNSAIRQAAKDLIGKLTEGDSRRNSNSDRHFKSETH